MKHYFRKFCKEQNGAEFMEKSIIIALVPVLAVIVFAIYAVIKDKLVGVKDMMEGIEIPSFTEGGGP